ncbi:hypothetical protein KIPB_001081, partial [Kipferlia bialata]|eukprot:g1081.t1
MGRFIPPRKQYTSKGCGLILTIVLVVQLLLLLPVAGWVSVAYFSGTLMNSDPSVEVDQTALVQINAETGFMVTAAGEEVVPSFEEISTSSISVEEDLQVGGDVVVSGVFTAMITPRESSSGTKQVGAAEVASAGGKGTGKGTGKGGYSFSSGSGTGEGGSGHGSSGLGPSVSGKATETEFQ